MMPNNNPPGVGVVVVAAGRSTRMDGLDKTFAPLLGQPLIAHTLDRFEEWPAAAEIVLVTAAESVARGRELALRRGYRKVTHVCAGGERRQDSVRAGLERLSPCGIALVHDGARPCLDAALLQRGLDAVADYGAASAGVPVKDTIKVVGAAGLVQSTPDRARLWQAQTPQLFAYDTLLDAHRHCLAEVTDDAAMVESRGRPVRMFLGAYENLKVTTPEDLALAEAFLRARGAN